MWCLTDVKHWCISLKNLNIAWNPYEFAVVLQGTLDIQFGNRGNSGINVGNSFLGVILILLSPQPSCYSLGCQTSSPENSFASRWAWFSRDFSFPFFISFTDHSWGRWVLIRDSCHEKGLGLTPSSWDEREVKIAPSRGVGMGLEADSQDQLHNLQDPVQNENSRLLVQKQGKSAITVVKI